VSATRRAPADPRSVADPWPRWTDRLPARSGSGVVEGGRRTTGHLKSGTPEQPLVTYVTIESVARQTYAAVEHVVLDGASTDTTLDLIRHNADRLDYFASEPDHGLYDALNKAIPLARGDVICVLNSDDWLEPDAAETAVGLVKDVSAPKLVLTGAHARQGAPGDKEPPVVVEWYPAVVHAGSYFTCADDCHNGIYATRSAYERSGPYDTSYEIAADFKWLMSCFEAAVDFVYSNDITVNYVLGGASSDAESHGAECVRAIQERFPALSTDEAGGLYHSFFAFPTFTSIPGRPSDRGDFLRGLLTRHSGAPELSVAVAWALLADADRHRDSHDGLVERAPEARPDAADRREPLVRDRSKAYRIVKRLSAGVRRT
jgi:hypothetical protein